jgi:hypothetical protein
MVNRSIFFPRHSCFQITSPLIGSHLSYTHRELEESGGSVEESSWAMMDVYIGAQITLQEDF